MSWLSASRIRVRRCAAPARGPNNTRATVGMGFAGALASIGWFTAFTLQNASYVRAVGQVELLFTFVATTAFFREKVTAAEIVGIVLVCAGILLLLLYG